jgi:hypothetical protein
MEMTTPRAEIPATAARQAIPATSGQSVNAAYAPSGKPTGGAVQSYDELNKRIETLSRELSALREEMSWLKTREADETE